jgi:hypothetical protein
MNNLKRMLRWAAHTLLVCAALAPTAAADTIHMKNGVPLDGKVVSENASVVKVQVGDRTVTLRKDEVARIVPNDRTGAFDKEKALQEARKRDEELTKQTGLNAAQRHEIKQILGLLARNDPEMRKEGKQRLLTMARDMDIIKYFEQTLPALLPRYVPGVLEVLVELNPLRARPLLVDSTTNVDAACRAKALELLGQMGDARSAELAARGLLDHHHAVRASAAMAFAQLETKAATPMLIERLNDGDAHVRSAAGLALSRAWGTVDAENAPENKREWQAYWKEHSAQVAAPMKSSAFEPLVPKGARFYDE